MVMPISGVGGWQPAPTQSSTTTNPLLQDLSSTLGLSATQIQQQLAGGSSLSQIAANQGVSQSTLLSAVEGALSSGPGQNLSSTQLSTLANNIVNRTGSWSGAGGAHHHHHGGGGGSQGINQLLQDLSSTLGLSETQIQQQLAGGSSLSQIAANQGVSQSTLLSAVEGALSSGPGQNLSSTQLSTLANDIVNRTGSPTGEGASTAGAASAPSTPPLSTDFLLVMVATVSPSSSGAGPSPSS